MSSADNSLDFGQTIRGFSPGQKVFSRYTLTRILGRGGMGIVWLARDGELDRDVALKFLPELVSLDQEAVADLKRETRRNLELSHPHIVRINDFESDTRSVAIAMEYVDGPTLAALKLQQPEKCFGAEELSVWVRQLCAALDYAHAEARIVHRDLKPANLMVNSRGQLKITDFGIARNLSDSVSRVSQQGATSGTPYYMSPQQMMGEKPAVADDVYAIGAMLYELVTGKPPFYSGNVLSQVVSKVPPTMAERRKELEVTSAGTIPQEWEETIAACLAKEASARPQSAGEVAERLGLVTGGSGSKSSTRAAAKTAPKVGAPSPKTESAGEALPKLIEPAPERRSRTGLYAGSAAVVIALVGGGYYFAIIKSKQATKVELVRLEGEAKPVADEKEKAARETARPAPAQASAKSENNLRPGVGKRWMIPGLNLAMMPIAPGTFSMGSEDGDIDEKPVTRVTLTKPYWLGTTEVTQAQYTAVTGTTPSKFKGDNLPVENVSWEEAMEYSRKLTERERAAGRLPAGYVYTLPSEAQWEYACRAGTANDYAGSLAAMGWYGDNSGDKAHGVGTKQANVWGLFDMHGNIYEWCSDWKGAYPGGSVTDPKGAATGTNRISRGGSWGSSGSHCRSSNRDGIGPGGRSSTLGFRLALSSVP